jgi:hypothetical protein
MQPPLLWLERGKMDSFVVKGKAKTVFKLLKLLAQAEQAEARDEDKGKIPRNLERFRGKFIKE